MNRKRIIRLLPLLRIFIVPVDGSGENVITALPAAGYPIKQ